MPIPKQHLGVKGDECQCGRRASIRHCPACGSSRVYAYMHPRFHQFADGSIKEVEREFRCQACAELFIDEEREYCEAPPVGQILAAQKVKALYEATKTGEYLRPEDKAAAEYIQAKLQPESKELTDNQLRNLDIGLRREWVDAKMRARSNGQKFEEECSLYVDRRLKESGYTDEVIERVHRIDEQFKKLQEEAQRDRTESTSS